LNLPAEGVMIVWKWEWRDDIDRVSETSSEGIAAINPDIGSCSDLEDEDEVNDEDNDQTSMPMHIVTFKCIGTTHHVDAQDTLCRASRLLDNNEHVPVDIIPEPSNPDDSKAIAFKCFVNGSWNVIGYVVKEALESVQSAHDQGRITAIEFSWIKYLITWGPGYYAGIDITVHGQWPAVVINCASTR